MENLTEDEFSILIEYEEELARTGGFEMIFPKASNIDYYS